MEKASEETVKMDESVSDGVGSTSKYEEPKSNGDESISKLEESTEQMEESTAQMEISTEQVEISTEQVEESTDKIDEANDSELDFSMDEEVSEYYMLKYNPRLARYEKNAADVNLHFNKKFQFQEPSEGAWQLPDKTKLFTARRAAITNLQVLKKNMNLVKSQLNDLNIEEWSEHTKQRNLSGMVCYTMKTKINPEFLTQAWLKFYECASSYNIVPEKARETNKLVSLHLCEAPGAFITSLNHYLQIHHPEMKWDWTASTLNPYYEGNSPSNMISDDRFVMYTLDRWCFGADNTGDLMKWTNAEHIIQKAREYGEVSLVTADGSIDCLSRPDEQENVTSALHYCELVTALTVLAEGGSFIYKLFTMFEQPTVNLLYMLACQFKELHIFKPVTSKEGNSEVYAICLGYKGYQTLEAYKEKLLKGFLHTRVYRDRSLFPLKDICPEFLRQVADCAEFFSAMQCNVINANLESYLMNNRECPIVWEKRNMVAKRYLYSYKIKPITRTNEILKGKMHEYHRKDLNINPRMHHGSYTQRLNYDSLKPKEKLLALESDMNYCAFQPGSKIQDGVIKWKKYYDDSDLELNIACGKPFKELTNSKFIYAPIFRNYRRLLCESKSVKNVPPMSLQELGAAYKVEVANWKTVALPKFDINNYARYIPECLTEMLKVLTQLKEGESLFIPDFDLLSHAAVAVLYILGKCFNQIGFTFGKGIICNEFVIKNKVNLLEKLSEEYDKCGEDRTVLRALPLLRTNKKLSNFYVTVVGYNNILYTQKSHYLLNVMRNALLMK